jgi:hypothetical protein
MIINIYKIGDKKPIVKNLRVRSSYESYFYFRNMPTIGERTSRKIIRENNLYNGCYLVFEDAKTGHRGTQHLYKAGTILNF